MRRQTCGALAVALLAAGTGGGPAHRLAAQPLASSPDIDLVPVEFYAAAVSADHDRQSPARPEIVIPRAAGGAQTTALTPQAMLREARVFRDLPLRAIGYAARGPGGNVKVIVLAEPVEPTADLRSAAVGLFDRQGQLAAQVTPESGLALSPGPGAPIVMELIADPGVYRMRVAATDAFGRAGTVDYTLEAVLTPAGPLTVSSMMVGIAKEGTFLPRLLFGAEREAQAYLEIYGATNGAPVTVTFELAASVNGPARLTIPGAIEVAGSPDRRIASGVVPIGNLAPGDYVVRALVAMKGERAGRVVRTLRKK